eukprot:5976395-Pyramimonas_sp.AAC.1
MGAGPDCKSISGKGSKKPAARALLEHISRIRQMMDRGVAHSARRCDARDVAAGGHAQSCYCGGILLQVQE